jgi:hypothetical protein
LIQRPWIIYGENLSLSNCSNSLFSQSTCFFFKRYS